MQSNLFNLMLNYALKVGWGRYLFFGMHELPRLHVSQAAFPLRGSVFLAETQNHAAADTQGLCTRRLCMFARCMFFRSIGDAKAALRLFFHS
jgi:hypothetical protein